METREHLEKEPPDLLPEIVKDIMHRIPVTLFAQASSYWRSYGYLREFQDAVLMQFEEEQERILTKLLINSKLLLKKEAQSNLPPWIHYLKKYYADIEIDLKNRLLAQALLLIIDENCTQRHWVEFEFVLHAYCFSVPKVPRHQLFHSLKAIVMTAKGMKTPTQEINIRDLLHSECNCIDSVYEAQLILAPFDNQHLQHLFDRIFLAVSRDCFHVWTSSRWQNLAILLHAAVKLMSCESDFWQKRQTTLSLVSQLPRSLYPEDGELTAARIDFIATLIKMIPASENPWNDKQLGSLDEMPERELELFKDISQAKRLCSLTNDKTNDDKRIEWLATSFSKMNIDWSLFSFAQRVCMQLTSDKARGKAIDVLLPLIKVDEVDSLTHHSRDENGKIIAVIRGLRAKCQSEKIKLVVARRLSEMYFKNTTCFNFWETPFLFPFPLEEQYLLRLEEEWLGLKLMDKNKSVAILRPFYFSLQSKQQIDYWLKKFQIIIDSLSDKDYEINFCCAASSSEVYTNLLAKNRDSSLLQKWQDTLYRLHINDRHLFHYKACEHAMRILPYLTCERAIGQWMRVLLEYLKAEGTNFGVFFDEFADCMSKLLPRLSPALRADYCVQIKDILFPKLVEPTLTFDDKSNLACLLSLLQQLPDELMLDLTPVTLHSTHVSRVCPAATPTK